MAATVAEALIMAGISFHVLSNSDVFERVVLPKIAVGWFQSAMSCCHWWLTHIFKAHCCILAGEHMILDDCGNGLTCTGCVCVTFVYYD